MAGVQGQHSISKEASHAKIVVGENTAIAAPMILRFRGMTSSMVPPMATSAFAVEALGFDVPFESDALRVRLGVPTANTNAGELSSLTLASSSK